MSKPKGAKGFNSLRGMTIVAVDAACVNQVVLLAPDGKQSFVIDAEIIDGVPHLTCKKRKVKVGAVLKPIWPRAKIWPYPPKAKT